MKTIANRMIVIGASALAFGTVAFGQTRMTAEVPFAFHVGSANLPAGNYEITEAPTGGISHLVVVRNTATHKGILAAHPTFNYYRRATDRAVAEFACGKNGCSLTAIRTASGALEYTPMKSKDVEKSVAVISVALKQLNAD